MPYGPHAADDRARMLEAIGVSSVDDLFEDIPEALRSGPLALDEPEAELLLTARLQALAARNRTGLACFLGAGAYRHWTPAVVDQMLLRGEWYTAYTPYQPEVSQGTLQSIYEYQSLVAALTGLDVVSASHYDGERPRPRLRSWPAGRPGANGSSSRAAVHPHYRATLETYAEGAGLSLDEVPMVADGPTAGTTDLDALALLLGDTERPVAGVVAAQPNVLGLIEDMPEIGRLAHDAGALFVSVIEPVSLAVLAPPAAYGADIAAGEGQPLGIPLGYGGPYLGIVSCTDALVRQIPGRLVGMTADLDGKRAFVMTMRAREQDIRREKAASNICTNQALLALAASIYLSAIGPHGLRDVAATGAARATELAAALEAIGAPRMHDGPYLNELVVRVPDARAVHARLLEHGVLAGIPTADLLPDEPSLADGLLVCATEVTTSDEITRFAEALATELRGVAVAGGTR